MTLTSETPRFRFLFFLRPPFSFLQARLYVPPVKRVKSAKKTGFSRNPQVVRISVVRAGPPPPGKSDLCFWSTYGSLQTPPTLLITLLSSQKTREWTQKTREWTQKTREWTRKSISKTL